jgi:hypothetical protein
MHVASDAREAPIAPIPVAGMEQDDSRRAPIIASCPARRNASRAPSHANDDALPRLAIQPAMARSERDAPTARRHAVPLFAQCQASAGRYRLQMPKTRRHRRSATPTTGTPPQEPRVAPTQLSWALAQRETRCTRPCTRPHPAAASGSSSSYSAYRPFVVLLFSAATVHAYPRDHAGAPHQDHHRHAAHYLK